MAIKFKLLYLLIKEYVTRYLFSIIDNSYIKYDAILYQPIVLFSQISVLYLLIVKCQVTKTSVAHDFKLFIGIKFLEMISENANMVPASCYSPSFLLYPVLNEGLLLFTASNEIRHLLNLSSKN